MARVTNSELLALGAPRSLWEASALPWEELPPLTGEARAEVAIVGGGICGLATALRLAEAGVKASVLEAESVAYGASGRNGGQVIPGLKLDPEELSAALGRERAEPLIEFIGRTADEVFDLIARYRIACNAVRHGWIQAAHTPSLLRRTHSRAQQWAQRGAPVAALSAEDIAAITGTVGYCGGWIDRRGGRLQPLDYCRGLARAARAQGAGVYEHSRVLQILPEAAGWRLITAQGTLHAAKLVLCMNAYARLDGAWSALQRAYVPVASAQLAFEPLDPEARASILKEDVAVSDTHPLLHYFRLDEAGRLIMGGPGTLRALHTPAQVRPLFEWMQRLFPRLAMRCRPQYYWGGDVARTLDHLPHLHQLHPGVYAFYGCNGRGVALATAAGGLLARLVLGARSSELPLPVTPLRALPLHAGYPLAIQAVRFYYTVSEHLRGSAPPLPPAAPVSTLERVTPQR